MFPRRSSVRLVSHLAIQRMLHLLLLVLRIVTATFVLCNQFRLFASNDCHYVSKIITAINNIGVSDTIFT